MLKPANINIFTEQQTNKQHIYLVNLGNECREVCLKQAMTARLRCIETTERYTFLLICWGWSI